MSYVYTWLGVLGGVVFYRAFSLNQVELTEHIAGLYFAALALLIHAIANKKVKP